MAQIPFGILQQFEAAAAAFGPDQPLVPGAAQPRREPAPARPQVAPSPPPVAAPAPRAADAHAQPAALARATPAPATVDPAAPPDELELLRQETLKCTRCKLHCERQRVVFGEGNPRAEIMFVGEAPGSTEDRTGRPFVGPAGQLLDKILANAMGLRREDVYIANVNKCRPPGNRDPQPDEVAACLPILQQQIALIRPKLLVALGRIAAHNLLGNDTPMKHLRGRDLSYQGIPLVVTWHPAFLLRDPSRKAETWDDIKRCNRLLGRPEIPGRGGNAADGSQPSA